MGQLEDYNKNSSSLGNRVFYLYNGNRGGIY